MWITVFFLVHTIIGILFAFRYGELPKPLTIFLLVFFIMSTLYWGVVFVFISYIYQDGWKIGSVGFTDENGAVEHPLTTALSGYVPE